MDILLGHYAASFAASLNIHQKIKNLANIESISLPLNQAMLPVPYDYLLTQLRPTSTSQCANFKHNCDNL